MIVENKLCLNCIHRDICIIKENYYNLCNYIEDFNKTSEHDEFIIKPFHVNISCKNYHTSYSYNGLTKFIGGTK